MSKMKKYLLTGISYVLVAALAIGGTFAYLQDSDEDVNVMTLGNVTIEQHEYERKVDANGNYLVDQTTYGHPSFLLKEFEQAKPLYPATEVDANGNPYNYGAGSWVVGTDVMFAQVGANGGGMSVFESENAVDKFVFVENTGKSDAYVRTIFAFEIGSKSVDEWKDLVGMSNHFSWDTPKTVGAVTIDGNNYAVVEMVYSGRPDKGYHANGILPAGEVTQCSLGQVYMKAEATNADCVAIDGNGNGTYDILVLSQAVQAAGFENAKTALDTAFGAITTTNHPWVNGAPALGWEGKVEDSWYDASENEYVITSAEELAGLAEMVNNGNTFKGKTVKLGANINLGNKAWTPIGQNGDKAGFQGTFDGQGHTISGLNVNQSSRAYQAAGLFGSARYATIKNFKIVNATIKNVDSADNSANGAAVVVGAAQFATTIDNVDVENATVIGNRRVSAIAGYFVGTISNCDVKNVELVATFDDLGNGNYDNCDKVGGIIAYSNGASTITNNTISNSKISGYRDIGGIAGYATTSTLTGNAVSDVEITILTEHNYKNYTTDAAHDAKAIIGEGSADATNTSANVTVKAPAVVSSAADMNAAIAAGKEEIIVKGATISQKLNLGSKASVTLVDCTFTGNNAWGYAKNANFVDCTFDSGSENAAIHFDGLYGNVEFTNCNFKSGRVQLGTADGASATFNNCVFGETASTSIWAEKGMRFYCPTEFNNCEFNNRVVLAGSAGLALTFDSCTMNGGSPVYYVDNTDGIIRGGNVPTVTIK